MPTNFPTSLDSFTDPVDPQTLAQVPHDAQHGNANDALLALETKVGVNGSAVTSTIDSKLHLWQQDVDANAHNLYGLATAHIGASSAPGNYNSLRIDDTQTMNSNLGPVSSLNLADVRTVATPQGFTFNGFIAVNSSWTINTGQSLFTIAGLNFAPTIGGSGTTGGMYAINCTPTLNVTGATDFVGVRVIPSLSGNPTNCIGLRVGGPTAGTPTTTVGLDIGVNDALAGTTIWGMKVGNYQSYHQGAMVHGAAAAPTNSSVSLEVNSTTQAFLLPRMTTTQKNALTAVDGMVVYDTTIPAIQGHVNGAWITL